MRERWWCRIGFSCGKTNIILLFVAKRIESCRQTISSSRYIGKSIIPRSYLFEYTTYIYIYHGGGNLYVNFFVYPVGPGPLSGRKSNYLYQDVIRMTFALCIKEIKMQAISFRTHHISHDQSIYGQTRSLILDPYSSAGRRLLYYINTLLCPSVIVR